MHYRAPRVVSFLLLALFAATSNAAESLGSVRTGSLPSLPDAGIAPRLFAIGSRLVAAGTEFTWILDENANEWSRIDWRPSRHVIGVAADGGRAFLLQGNEGTDEVAHVEEVRLVGDRAESRTLPPLPMRLAGAQGAVLRNTLWIAGSDADGAARLMALLLLDPERGWIAHRGWPTGNGKVTSMAAQSGALYLTLHGGAGRPDRLLRFEPDRDWADRGTVPGTVVEWTACALGQAHVLYLVKSDPHENAVATLTTYHTITGSWARLAHSGAPGARSGAPWKGGIIWEARAHDGAGGNLAFAQLESRQLKVHLLDWIVIVVYLAGMTGIGLYFYLREKRVSTADFFVGSRAIPFWAAGVSLYATNTSSISYIAIPAKAFETNWTYLQNNLVAVTGLVFVAIWVVPLLRRLDLMSVFHYLEIRFHPAIRMLASALCIAVQIGSRLSVVLFLPSLAIATVTGLDVAWSIVIMGAVTIAYTAMGGMKAVIWTDFAQLFVMFGGALFAIAFIVSKLDGGVGEFFATATIENKMKLFDWNFDLTQATVWGFIFLVVFDVILTFPKDQVLMQRVLSTKNARDAGRSVWMFAAIMIPGGFLFYFIGTSLYVFYKHHPERMDPTLTIDATFPLFIAAELPIGVAGLIIAGILAASMSTLSSIMNSVATLISVDFYEKIVKKPNPQTSVRFAEAMTIIVGLIGIGGALLLSRYDIRSMFDVSIELAGLMGGGFAGAYTLGMFTRRANAPGIAIGIATAIVLTTYAWSKDLVHPYYYLGISILTCIVVGYLASLFFAPPARSLAGLTIYEEKPAGQSVIS